MNPLNAAVCVLPFAAAGRAETAGTPLTLDLPKPCKQGTPLPFNDNSSGLGAGRDPSWLGLHWGRPVAANGVRARHVRCHSRGNTSNEMNHYIEVEVWGRP